MIIIIIINTWCVGRDIETTKPISHVVGDSLGQKRVSISISMKQETKVSRFLFRSIRANSVLFFSRSYVIDICFLTFHKATMAFILNC